MKDVMDDLDLVEGIRHINTISWKTTTLPRKFLWRVAVVGGEVHRGLYDEWVVEDDIEQCCKEKRFDCDSDDETMRDRDIWTENKMR